MSGNAKLLLPTAGEPVGIVSFVPLPGVTRPLAPNLPFAIVLLAWSTRN